MCIETTGWGEKRESLSTPHDPVNDLTFVPIGRLELLKLVTFHVKQYQLSYQDSVELGRKIRDVAMPEVKRVAKDYQLMLDVDKIPAEKLHPQFVEFLKDHVWPLVV
jgi:hypothetical protein